MTFKKDYKPTGSDLNNRAEQLNPNNEKYHKVRNGDFMESPKKQPGWPSKTGNLSGKHRDNRQV